MFHFISQFSVRLPDSLAFKKNKNLLHYLVCLSLLPLLVLFTAFLPPAGPSVQVLHDLLQQRVQAHVHLCLVQQLDEVHVVGDDLTQVGHFLQQLGEQLQGVRVVELQLQLQRVKNRLLKLLNGLHVEQARPVWMENTDGGVS